MKEKKIKIFSSPFEAGLEKSVNAFMQERNVIDVQFNTYAAPGGTVYFSAMIVYEV
jgi:hypothetical protein